MAIQGLEFDKPTLVDGGHEQKAIVNTASGKQHVNAPTVEDIKRIAKGEAETEGDKSYTKAESDAKFLSKTDAASTYYTKTESDAKYQTKIDTSIFLGSITKTGTQDLNIQDGQLVILKSARNGGISIGLVFFNEDDNEIEINCNTFAIKDANDEIKTASYFIISEYGVSCGYFGSSITLADNERIDIYKIN